MKSRMHVGIKHTLEQLRNQVMVDLTSLLEKPDFSRLAELRVEHPFLRYDCESMEIDAMRIAGIRSKGFTDAEIIITNNDMEDDSDWTVPMNEVDTDNLVSLIEQLEKEHRNG